MKFLGESLVVILLIIKLKKSLLDKKKQLSNQTKKKIFLQEFLGFLMWINMLCQKLLNSAFLNFAVQMKLPTFFHLEKAGLASIS